MRCKYLLCLILVVLVASPLVGCMLEITEGTQSTTTPFTTEQTLLNTTPSATEPTNCIPTESNAPTASNVTNMHETPVVSQEHIDYLWDYAYVGSGYGIPLEEFIQIFGESCVRNIDGHPYAVLQKLDGTKLFVFFDWNSENCLIQEVAPFVQKEEFEAFLEGEWTDLKDVVAFNGNVVWQMSSRPFGVFYVDKGAFLVEFSWDTDKQGKRYYYVESAQYITEEELQYRPEESLPAKLWLWHILPEDKE